MKVLGRILIFGTKEKVRPRIFQVSYFEILRTKGSSKA